MSSFRRNLKKNEDQNTYVGVKPWLNCGLGMISSGLKELDDFIGGGIPLGTVTLLIQDDTTNYAKTLVAYNIAEGTSVGHACLILTTLEATIEELLNGLPWNQYFKSAATKITSENPGHTLTDLDAGIGTDLSNSSMFTTDEVYDIINASSELKIAHAYRKYIAKAQKDRPNLAATTSVNNSVSAEGTALSERYCYSYDLTRSLQDEILSANPPRIVCAEEVISSLSFKTLQQYKDNSSNHERSKLHVVLDTYLDALLNIIARNDSSPSSGTAGSVKRVYLPDISQLLAVTGERETEVTRRLLSRFIIQVRQAVRNSRVSVLIAVDPGLHSQVFLARIANLCDAALRVESFVGRLGAIPHEFKSFCGFLYVDKLSSLGALAAYRGPAGQLGLKRDRRKLRIELLHLPPEESRALASATSAVEAKATSTSLATSTSPFQQSHQHQHLNPSAHNDNSNFSRLATHLSYESASGSSAQINHASSSNTASRIALLAARFSSNSISGTESRPPIVPGSSISISSASLKRSHPVHPTPGTGPPGWPGSGTRSDYSNPSTLLTNSQHAQQQGIRPGSLCERNSKLAKGADLDF